MTTAEPGLADAVLGASRGRHAFEDCVERLATAIRLGVYPDGSSLPPERELAMRMGVSRATLREAIAALRTAKMVRTTRGRRGGTTIDHAPITPGQDPSDLTSRRGELMDSLVFRRVVEPGACYLAASEEQSVEHRQLLQDALTDVAAAVDPAEHRQADSRFHLTVAALTESPRVIEAVTSVQATLHEMLLAIPVLQANIAHSDRQHAALVRAILSGNTGRARRVMAEHCDDTAALLRGLVG
jgi:GntR family transcriptional repressor for pyruvate dehydrogenase complex